MSRFGIEAEGEQHHQRDERRKRQQELPHQAEPSSARGFGGRHDARRGGRHLDPVAPIGRGDQSAERHDDGAQPDVAHQRLVLNAHAPGVRRPADRPWRRTNRAPSSPKWRPCCCRSAAPRNGASAVHSIVTGLPPRVTSTRALHRIVVGSAHIGGVHEFEIVARDRKAAARLQCHVLLDFVALDAAGADRKHADAQVRDRHPQQRRASAFASGAAGAKARAARRK